MVSLASPSFFYSAADRRNYRNGIPLPPKMGSFQLFLNGYKDATSFFKTGYDQIYANAQQLSSSDNGLFAFNLASSTQNLLANPEHPLNWTSKTQREFQMGFERLVVLDYMIRNTDRGSDNWMVRFNSDSTPSPPPEESILHSTQSPFAGTSDEISVSDGLISHAQNSSTEFLNNAYVKNVSIQVAAIDNGLAFPYKHPDRWRTYPYGWSFLPIARLPFTSATRSQVVHLLTSQEWWSCTLQGLERLFRLDPDFSEKMWKKQRAVIRGQGYNLVEALRRGEEGVESGTPAGLLKRPVVAVYDEEVQDAGGVERLLRRVGQRFETFTREQPCFSWC